MCGQLEGASWPGLQREDSSRRGGGVGGTQGWPEAHLLSAFWLLLKMQSPWAPPTCASLRNQNLTALGDCCARWSLEDRQWHGAGVGRAEEVLVPPICRIIRTQWVAVAAPGSGALPVGGSVCPPTCPGLWLLEPTRGSGASLTVVDTWPLFQGCR